LTPIRAKSEWNFFQSQVLKRISRFREPLTTAKPLWTNAVVTRIRLHG